MQNVWHVDRQTQTNNPSCFKWKSNSQGSEWDKKNKGNYSRALAGSPSLLGVEGEAIGGRQKQNKWVWQCRLTFDKASNHYTTTQHRTQSMPGQPALTLAALRGLATGIIKPIITAFRTCHTGQHELKHGYHACPHVDVELISISVTKTRHSKIFNLFFKNQNWFENTKMQHWCAPAAGVVEGFKNIWIKGKRNQW